MNPVEIIHLYYPPRDKLTQVLLHHSEQVRDKALAVAEKVPHLTPDLDFISQAAMLHDIGILQTGAAGIQCRHGRPYICHGVIGRDMLERHGLRQHALICERHVGAGISRQDILSNGLPLPVRDMLPITLEEIIVCYADKFFSKANGSREHRIDRIIAKIQRYGKAQADRFIEWHNMFSA